MNQCNWQSNVAGFMGRITVDVCHDLKNAIATIKEQSHLMEELLMFARQNEQIYDPAKLENLTGRMIKRLETTDETLKTLSRFAHSAEKGEEAVVAWKSLDVMVRLLGRFASHRKVRLNLLEGNENVHVNANAVLLNQAVTDCLIQGIQAAGTEGKVDAGVERNGDRVKLVFVVSGPEADLAFEIPSDDPFPDEELMTSIEAECRTEPGGRLILEMPWGAVNDK